MGVEDAERRWDEEDGDGSGEGRGDDGVDEVSGGNDEELPTRVWPTVTPLPTVLVIVPRLKDWRDTGVIDR